jgi:hypothetical protein
MKFTVTGTTEFTVTVNWQRKVDVTKAQVVEALELEGEDKREWKDSVLDYLESEQLHDWSSELEMCLSVQWDSSNGDIEAMDIQEVEVIQDRSDIEDVEE